jgi:hypothetical protein
MADYYPLIARAVGGLERNTGENRRALYERARGALVSQLRGVEPALNETDITRERLALEEAIRKVEAEAAKRSRDGAEEQPEPSLRDRGLRDFRETVAEAEGLGGAAAESKRAAHATYEAIPVEPAPVRHDPDPPTIPERADAPVGAEHTRDLSHLQPPPPLPPSTYSDDDEYTRPARSYADLVKLFVVFVILAAVAGGLYWQRHAISSVMSSFRSQPASKPKEAAQPAVRPKIADRIGQTGETAPSTANAPAAAVAQKVVLYDEDPNDPQGKRYVGSALWRTETVSPGPGLAPELAVRADIEIPERKLRMTWSLRRNSDKALPASHTIEILFTLPPDFPEGGIGNVPGVLMKQSEQARGVPLAGLAVKVTDGYFLIGLSAVDSDVQRNVQLLKERDWFDIPVVYTSGKRAILAMEKGTPGTRAFEEAFRAWGQ